MIDKKQLKYDKAYLKMASEWAKLSYCKRRQVGALIVKDRMIISDGYNGTPTGLDNNCEDDEGYTKWYVLHAEANAIVQAAKNGVKVDASEIYVTASPCYNCFKLIANAGIKIIYYDELYRDARIIERAKEVGIELISLEDHAKG